MFFNGWFDLLRVLVVGTLAYAALIILLRFSGKRTLSKMNAFDFVVTVALGSILASILLSKSVALVEGILAFTLLIALQFIIAWLSVRFDFVERLVKSEPTLLLYQGKLLEQAMKAERVTAAEVYAAARSSGVSSLEELQAVILETNGNFNVIPKRETSNYSTLENTNNYGSVAS